MAKRIKTTKREYVALATSDDFERARNHLRQRANSLIIELAKRYDTGKSEELTAVLNAMDSVAELEGMEPACSWRLMQARLPAVATGLGRSTRWCRGTSARGYNALMGVRSFER